MTVDRTTGLVFRTRPLTESSLVVQWITPDQGRIATVAKGARRPNSPFRGKLDLFYRADFSFRRSRRSDLHLLHEVVVRDYHPLLRRELHLLQQISHCARLIEHHTETESPIPEIYQLFSDALHFLPVHPGVSLATAAFEIRLLKELGLQPDLAQSNLKPGSREILHRLVELPWALLPRLKPAPQQVEEIQSFLSRVLQQAGP